MLAHELIPPILLPVRDSTLAATEYVHRAIATSYPLGAGNGPLNHLNTITYRPLPPYVPFSRPTCLCTILRLEPDTPPLLSAHCRPTATDPLPFVTHIINEVNKTGLWQAYINHPFVEQLGKGTLDRRRFEHYIKSVA